MLYTNDAGRGSEPVIAALGDDIYRGSLYTPRRNIRQNGEGTTFRFEMKADSGSEHALPQERRNKFKYDERSGMAGFTEVKDATYIDVTEWVRIND